jgi:MraZ protein
MFRGTHLYSVDDKGRVAIPARFIKVLSGLQDECLVVTRFKRRNRPCLDVYPLSAWHRFEEKIAAEKRFNKQLSAFESWYVGAAQDVQIDGQGRMLIPPTLRKHAGIGREVMFVGDRQVPDLGQGCLRADRPGRRAGAVRESGFDGPGRSRAVSQTACSA